MGALNQRLYPNVLLSIDSSTFTGSYQVLVSSLANSSRIIKITNNCTKDITVSWDGIADHEFVPAGSFILLDASANRETSNICEISQGTTILVKGSAGTGSVYFSSYYAR